MMQEPREILKKYWGYDAFRAGQEPIVHSILKGNDTLALLPTGGGKSICFQVPGLILEGFTLVVSPLIALMKDQVDGLIKRGIHAAFLNSAQSWKEQKIIMENALKGYYDFLYVAPERLSSEGFREYLPNLKINALIIDEAHCISMWGSDFRPSFRRIWEIRELLPSSIPVAAFTASAPPWIQEDIISGIKLKSVAVHQGAFGRQNLVFQNIQSSNKSALLLEALKKTQGSTIVFAPTRKSVQETAVWLQSQGVSAHFYHGGLPNSERATKQQEWIEDKVRVMVCTNAFGMGVDKPNVRYVFHLAPSTTPEDYYQEAGRAGRDGKKSYGILFHEPGDWIKTREQIEAQHPSAKEIERVYHAMMNTLGVSPGHGRDVSYPFNYTECAQKYKIPLGQFYHSLRALEKIGFIELNEGITSPSKFMFIADYTEVYDYKIRYASYEYLIDVLLRSFSGVFDQYTAIKEEQIAKRLKRETNAVVIQLKQLHKSRLIDYIPQTTDPIVTLFEPRSVSPSINMKQLDALKYRRLDSLEKLEIYAHQKSCRSAFWVDYFTQQKVPACGSCDWCKSSQRYTSSQDIQQEIRECLSQGAVGFHEFTWSFPLDFRNAFYQQLEKAIDQGWVVKTHDNQLILSN